MLEGKICSFFGHRNVAFSQEKKAQIEREIKKAIFNGCYTFYFGGYGDFDDVCYQTVEKIKKENPQLNLKSIYCVSQERYLNKKVPYFNKEDYDDVIYLRPSFTGWYKSIYFRNCAMIDHSDYVIFYAEERENSGAYKAYKYAKTKKNKIIINVYN